MLRAGRSSLSCGDKSVASGQGRLLSIILHHQVGQSPLFPEVMAKTMLINYSVTQDGLANQLLNVVVGHERPDSRRTV